MSFNRFNLIAPLSSQSNRGPSSTFTRGCQVSECPMAIIAPDKWGSTKEWRVVSLILFWQSDLIETINQRQGFLHLFSSDFDSCLHNLVLPLSAAKMYLLTVRPAGPHAHLHTHIKSYECAPNQYEQYCLSYCILIIPPTHELILTAW